MVSLIALVFYAAGVVLSTQAGLYFIRLLDYFLTTWTVFLLSFFQVMALAWVYGVDNFLDNIKWMIRYYVHPYVYWKLLYKFLLPLLLLAGTAFCWADYVPMWYNGYEYPPWGLLLGWTVSILPILAIPVTAVYQIGAGKGSFFARLRAAMSPCEDWGPALAVHRAEHFPLQIPEARRPLRPSRPMSASPPPPHPDQLPRFQRETAI